MTSEEPLYKIFAAVKFSLSRLVPGHNGLSDNLSESHERCENWAKYTIHLYPINTQPYQQHSLQLVSARVHTAEKRSGPLKHSLLTQRKTETFAKRSNWRPLSLKLTFELDLEITKAVLNYFQEEYFVCDGVS